MRLNARPVSSSSQNSRMCAGATLAWRASSLRFDRVAAGKACTARNHLQRCSAVVSALQASPDPSKRPCCRSRAAFTRWRTASLHSPARSLASFSYSTRGTSIRFACRSDRAVVRLFFSDSAWVNYPPTTARVIVFSANLPLDNQVVKPAKAQPPGATKGTVADGSIVAPWPFTRSAR